MNSIIGDKPKALIEISGRTLVDHLLADLYPLGLAVTLVTNYHFYNQFAGWQVQSDFRVKLLNDGSTHVDNRLGAIGDLSFALEQQSLDDDLLVLAADNLLSFSLAGLLSSFRSDPVPHLCIWENTSLEDQKRRGVVVVDGDQVISFSEKPDDPESLLAAAPIYLIPRAQAADIARYLNEGGNPDAPGYFMEYLVSHYRCKAWRLPGELIDVGNPESYRAALSRPDR